jgi:hypothetical protein
MRPQSTFAFALLSVAVGGCSDRPVVGRSVPLAEVPRVATGRWRTSDFAADGSEIMVRTRCVGPVPVILLPHRGCPQPHVTRTASGDLVSDGDECGTLSPMHVRQVVRGDPQARFSYEMRWWWVNPSLPEKLFTETGGGFRSNHARIGDCLPGEDRWGFF